MSKRIVRLGWSGTEQIFVVDALDGEAEVDAVEEGTGELLLVVLDLGGSAGALVGGVAEVATGAGVHGGDQHEVGGVVGLEVGARDSDLAIFERLAEGLEDGARVFGELVEEEDAVVGEGDFARGGFGAAADDGDGRGGVVWSAEGAGADDVVAEAGEGVEFGDFDLFGGGEGREQGKGGAGEEGLAGAGRAGDEEVVVAGDGDDEGAFGGGLTADLV